MRSGAWTISNILSLSRIILLAPISVLLLQDDPSDRWLILALIAAAALTDLLDGMLARKLNQVTELGKILDPVADKICIAVVGLILLFQLKIPFWFFLALILRDAMILSGGVYLRRKRGIILPSNTAGKWAASAVAAYLMFAFADIGGLNVVTQILLALSTLLLIISSFLYIRRFRNVLRNFQNNNQ